MIKGQWMILFFKILLTIIIVVIFTCSIILFRNYVVKINYNKIENAKKLSALSYEEMLEISSEGAKVLHNRSIEIGEKYKIPIITKSTFNNKPGTVISDIIEENTIKSIVKKDCSRISIIGNGIIRNTKAIKDVLDIIEKNKLDMLEFDVSESKVSITFKNIVDNDILEMIHKKIV